jgi:hypothetical protein
MRQQGKPRRRLTRQERAVRAGAIAEVHSGVAHRRDLREAGVTRGDVRSEVSAGRWETAGRHTVVIGTGPPRGRALLWQAVWETGAGAVLDGVSALQAAGLLGFVADHIDVAIRANNRSHTVSGVRRHRRRELGPVRRAGLPRARPEQATVRAAEWARTDRTAVLIVCLAVQQRLVSPPRLLEAWAEVGRSRRRLLLDAVIRDICDGAHSLGELDFAGLCRQRGLPEPTRQAVHTLASGRVYLDVEWEEIGLVVEVDGGHHAAALASLDDALRQNEVVLAESTVLRIPVVGLRLRPDDFLDQVVRAHALLAARAA